ncbi:MAG TPA: hypothetical protein VMB50_23410 [Myxococcales bacterium]|nr:hypothetical protein [Myxococcales bacterium]
MHWMLSLRGAAVVAVLSAAGLASADGLHVRGGGRVLTVSGEPLLVYHLVEPGRSVEATAEGPLVVSLKLRRHSRSHHGGTARAVLELDGGEMDRFVLEAQPAGRYLAGFGFAPGPEKKRQIKLGPGKHRLSVRALAGSIIVAFSAGDEELEVAPLVAQAPVVSSASVVRATPENPVATSTGAQATAEEPVPPKEIEAQPGPSDEPVHVEQAAPVSKGGRPAHVLLELRVGSATQTQVGSTGFGGGIDLRYFVARRFSIGLGADAYGVALGGKLSGSPAPEAVGPLALDASVIAVPVLLEAAYDQPLGSVVALTLGLGAGAEYQRISRSATSGTSALAEPVSQGAAPVGEALAGLSIRAPGGRVGVEVRLSSSLPQDIDGVARGAVVGALLAEVGYQFLL